MAQFLRRVIDRIPGELLSSHETVEGYRWYEGRGAVAGVYEYLLADGSIVKELIDVDVLGAPESLGTMGGKPVTLQHPDEQVGLQNVRALSVGHIGETVDFVEEGGFVRVRFMVDDADALRAIDDGTRELSFGYDAVIDDTPGVHERFGAYDRRQVRRTAYNHLAIVDAARHGPQARFRADAVQRTDAAAPVVVAPEVPMLTKSAILELLAALAPGVDNAESVADGILQLRTKGDGEESEDADEGSEMARLRQANADLQSELEDMRAKMAGADKGDDEDEEGKGDAADTLAARVAWAADRARWSAAAAEHKIEVTDSMDNDAIQAAVVKSIVDAVGKPSTDKLDDAFVVDANHSTTPANLTGAQERILKVRGLI